jgi:hypothetical protein
MRHWQPLPMLLMLPPALPLLHPRRCGAMPCMFFAVSHLLGLLRSKVLQALPMLLLQQRWRCLRGAAFTLGNRDSCQRCALGQLFSTISSANTAIVSFSRRSVHRHHACVIASSTHHRSLVTVANGAPYRAGRPIGRFKKASRIYETLCGLQVN